MDTIQLTTYSFRFPTIETQECAVCFDTKALAAFPASTLTSTCRHSPSTCLVCIKSSIRSDLEAGKPSSRLACPECESLLSFDDVLKYADDESRGRYEELAMREALEGDEDFIWCAAGCGSGQVHSGGTEQPIVKCTLCGSRTCFQHKTAWHAGLTCDEWDLVQARNDTPVDDISARVGDDVRIRRYREVKASEETIKQTTKKCPGCARSIEKNGGW
ncbi:hypothetical protein B0T14DRAFT_430801 [Immersiella caudata]|uniref:RBR-type E3 ubiquitin transferase n=1 Tax=Immersiella caudata TaxID=314043 RepID=A0AA39WQ02_9PEZI|nr:hypothetical protein B0T14DRAFT_430801 [Immersiella caudata]